jgi:drug/metabolite transporter (DMT)-like permease
VSFAGVLAILAHGELARLLELRPNAGDLWVLFAMLFWALYTVLLAHRPPRTARPLLPRRRHAVGPGRAGAFLPVGNGFAGRLIVPGLPAFAAIAYAGIFPAALGFIFWNRAVAEVGGNRAGQFMHLMPAFGTILAMLFLGEQPALYHLAGIALILAGIFLTTRVRA